MSTNLFVIPCDDCLVTVGDADDLVEINDELPESLHVDGSLVVVVFEFGEPRFRPHVTFDFTSL